MNDIQDRLTVSLHRQAEGVDARRPLARGAYDRARKLQVRRRVIGGVASLVALAVAIPVGIGLLPDKGNQTQPVNPRPSVKAGPVKIAFDITKLDKGSAPKVPYYSKGAIHDGDKTVPVTAREVDYVSFAKTAYGYAVQVDTPEGDGKTTLLDAGGRVRKNLGAVGLPVVSSDGRTLAWSAAPTAEDADDQTADLVVADAATGAEKNRVFVNAFGPTPVGFAGDRVIFKDDTADNGITGVWDTKTKRTSLIKDLGQAVATDGRQLVVAETGLAKDDKNACWGVYDMSLERLLWKTCSGFPQGISEQQSLYVFGSDFDGRVTVYDAHDGGKLAVQTAPRHPTSVTSEPGGDLLLVARGGEGDAMNAAIVRCTTDGRCEGTTDVLPTTDDGPAYRIPGLR